MGELTVWVCSLGSVVLMLMVLAVAIVTTMERTDSGDVARMREALAPAKRKA